MGLIFLFNSAGAVATAFGSTGSGTTAAGYSGRNLVAGPRSERYSWRSTSSNANSIGITYDQEVPITHVVIAGADWLLTKAGQQVIGRQYNGSAWNSISGFNFNPLTAADLVGWKSQDLVVPVTVTDQQGIGIHCVPKSGTEASQIAKLFGSVAFSLDSSDPSFGVGITKLSPGERRTPMRGTLPYEVECEFTLRFKSVWATEYDALRSATNLLYWPFYLYDPDQTIWEWKLEHVLLGGLQATPAGPNGEFYNVDMQFSRLRHYS